MGLLNLALCGRRVPEYGFFFGFFGSLAISLVALLVSRALLPARRASAYGLTIACFPVLFATLLRVATSEVPFHWYKSLALADPSTYRSMEIHN